MDFYLKKIQTKNFRNLSNQALDLNTNINCIFGKNGNGKTNLLEAIYFITNGKSFRKKTSFPQLLSMDADIPEIQLSSVFTDNKDKVFLSGKIGEKIQNWYKNNEVSKRKTPVSSVFINPFDSYQFHNIPAYRRSLIDSLISELYPQYKKILSQLNKIIKSRNAILCEYPINKQLLNSYQEKFNQFNYEITYFRKEFIEQLNEFITTTFWKVFSEKHELKLTLDSKLSAFNENQCIEFLNKRIDDDLTRRVTSYSINRDDYLFQFDGFSSYEYCSLGQQKMSYLSLLFAYIELFRYKFNSYPIVLIDDVSGELDSTRWTNLISYLEGKDFQTIITTANESFKEELERTGRATKILIDNGYLNNI